MLTAQEAKRIGLNEKEKALLKTLDEECLDEVIYVIDNYSLSHEDLEELIPAYNLHYQIVYSNSYFLDGAYDNIPIDRLFSLEELKKSLINYQSDGFTHLDEDEFRFVKVSKLSDNQLRVLKGALNKYREYVATQNDKQEKSKIANAKKELAQKKKEIAALEELIGRS